MDYYNAKDIALCRSEEGTPMVLLDTGKYDDRPVRITEEQLRYLFSASGKPLSNVNND